MIFNEEGSVLHGLNDRRPRAVAASHREPTREPTREPARSQRTIVIRQGSAWQSMAFLCLCLLLLAVVLMGHQIVKGLDTQNQLSAAAMARVERKVQQLESNIAFDTKRRQLLLGMRNQILKTNPRVSVGDAYTYARLALEACEKYPAIDPLLLLAIGVVESGYDPTATSRADARGLYQIWPSTGRLLIRALGWNYDEQTLYDAQKNTEAAALYLDILFSTYNDPQMVLAEYNGGPLNAGFFRANAGALAAETKNYVPRVLELHARLKEQFDKGVDLGPEVNSQSVQREGKTLAGAAALASAAAGPARGRAEKAPASSGSHTPAPVRRDAR
jgi:soluble lytic murein transglycosylase-like protein